MDVEVAEAAVVAADVVRELGLLLRPPEAYLRSRQLLQLNAEITLHRRPPEVCLRNRQLPQLSAETMLRLRRRLQRLAPITIRNCSFTLFRTEGFEC